LTIEPAFSTFKTYGKGGLEKVVYFSYTQSV